MQTVQIPAPVLPASGFNPHGLTPDQVREDVGWYLLNEGDAIQEGDGFWDEEMECFICWECRPDIFRTNSVWWKNEPHRESVHTRAWRRKRTPQPERTGEGR